MTFFDDYRAHCVSGFHKNFRTRVLSALRSCSKELLTAGLGPLLAARGRFGGVFVQRMGPRAATAAERSMFGTYGDVLGISCAHEAVLCAEIGLPYALVCEVSALSSAVDALLDVLVAKLTQSAPKMEDKIKALSMQLHCFVLLPCTS